MLALCAAFGAAAIQAPAPAFAANDDFSGTLGELQQRVEETAKVYNESLEKLAGIEGQIADIQAQIDDISERLPDQKQKSAQAAAEFYRMQRSSNTLLEILFSSQSFADLASRVEYITRLQDAYIGEINALTTMNDSLTEAKAALETARSEAQAEATHAQEALADAQAAREEAQRSAEAAARAQEAASGAQLVAPGGESNGMGDIPQSVTWGDDKESFVAEWEPRINAYLGSYPLGGFGREFASAAWDYGVDPRVAVAISTVESGNGRYCFRQCNAWGWGQVSWPDWPTAIDAYTAGFARGYGYTITLEGAKRYTPPSWEAWYPQVVNEMSKI
jgi:hypothetical protein